MAKVGTFNNQPGGMESKRPIYGQDTIVFLANAGGTGDVTIQYRLEEDW